MVDFCVCRGKMMLSAKTMNAAAVFTAVTRHTNLNMLGLERPCRVCGVCLGGQRDSTTGPLDVFKGCAL